MNPTEIERASSWRTRWSGGTNVTAGARARLLAASPRLMPALRPKGALELLSPNGRSFAHSAYTPSTGLKRACFPKRPAMSSPNLPVRNEHRAVTAAGTERARAAAIGPLWLSASIQLSSELRSCFARLVCSSCPQCATETDRSGARRRQMRPSRLWPLSAPLWPGQWYGESSYGHLVLASS